MLKTMLVNNEIAKLFGRTGSRVMLGMPPLLTAGAGLLAKQAGDEELAAGNVWAFMRLAITAVPSLTDFAALFAIIAAAGIVAAEFSSGTIKLLLVRPYSRAEILLSKYVAVLLFGLAMTVIVLLSMFVGGGLLFGFGGGDQNYYGIGMASFVLRAAGFHCLELFVLSTFAFMLSTVLRHNAAAIGLSLFMLLAGPQFGYMLRDYGWSKYMLFANTDLIAYTMDRPFMDGMTLGFSVTLLAVHALVFIALAWTVFGRRDVAG